MTHSPSKSPQTVGERIRTLRGYLSLTRKQFAKKYHIPEPTLVSWELSRTNQISSSSIKKLIDIFAQENIQITEEWLLNDTGASPLFAAVSLENQTKDLFAQIKEKNLASNPLALEIALFRKLNSHSVIIKVMDNTMAPYYVKGDHIGGVQIDLKKGNYKLGKAYVVTLDDGTQILRILYKGKEKELYTLGCFNLTDCSNSPVFYDVPIKELYNIIWIRKAD